MSENYVTYGVVVEINPNHDSSDFWNRIDHNNDYDKFGITSNNKFAYTIYKKMESYNFSLMIFDSVEIEKMTIELIGYLSKYGLESVGVVKPYIQQYYSGCDSVMSMYEGNLND